MVKNVKLRNIFYPVHSGETSQANDLLGIDLHTCFWFGRFGDAELLNVKLKCRELNRECCGVAGLIPAVRNVKLRSYLACGNWISQVNYSLSVELCTCLWLGSSGDAELMLRYVNSKADIKLMKTIVLMRSCYQRNGLFIIFKLFWRKIDSCILDFYV